MAQPPVPLCLRGKSSNPPDPPVPGTDGTIGDSQLNGTFVKPYSYSTFTATQYWQYKCSNINGGNPVNISGPLSIVRTVSQNPNKTWMYTVTKINISATINPPP
jgi:hypothetical protein